MVIHLFCNVHFRDSHSDETSSKASETSNQTRQDRGDFQHKHFLSLKINNPH